MESKELVEVVDQKKIKEYLDTFGLTKQLSPQETAQFTQIAQAYQLNPFKREIYCIPYGQGQNRRLSIITGYEVYLKRAERTGKLDGWKCWTEGNFKLENGLPVGDMKAVIQIKRKDWTEPFLHEVYLDEYAQNNSMWRSKTRTMLKKVCIAQGFRMAFPDELGGMPYSQEELPDEPVNVTPQKEEPAKQSEPTNEEAKRFRDAVSQIAELISKTDGSDFYFSDDERKTIKETAKAIGEMNDKRKKLELIEDLLESTRKKFAEKKELDQAAEEVFDDPSQQEIF